jgi:HD-like signal output (HDOD) protein
MTKPALSTINSQIESFPALPATVLNVLEITSDPESSANDLMQAILPDQTMCSAILKVANSALFGIPREVSTIQRAVVVLGFEEIKNIVIGKAIFAALPKLSKEHRGSVTLFWEHAFTCGLAAKIIGEHLRISPSELFIAGLIHDIGKIAMLMTFPNDYPILRQVSSPDKLNYNTAEKSNFSISHDRVGLLLAKRWLLPEKLAMAIGYHHSPQDAADFNQYPLIVQAADILSLIYCYSEVSEGKDVEIIFKDFLPETKSLWQQYDLNWDIENLGIWFEKLQQIRDNDQGLLDIFTSP